MKISRRTFFYSAVPAIPAVAYPVLIEPRWFDVTHTPVRVGLRQPVRVLHLSDLHLSSVFSLARIQDAITAGLATRPDLICLTGDYVTVWGRVSTADYPAALRRLSQAAPTFAVVGNHDGGLWTQGHGGARDHSAVDRILESAGIELLQNRFRRVEIRGEKLAVAGVGDLWGDEIDAGAALGSIPESDRVILLSHNPDSKGMFARHRWDLMLSGHTHGGQVILPLLGESYAPVVDKNYVAGLKPWQGRQIFITRGVGNVAGVRFNCRPEVSVLELA
ncbi:MAG: phosphodiesterase YaeI [Bryobacteraceae bacterium]